MLFSSGPWTVDSGRDEEPVAVNCGDTLIFYGSPGERATRRRS